jgi:hypothetical protein
MGIIKMFTAPVRTFVRFPLVQLVIVVGIILWLQAADDNSTFGNLFNGLDRLVSSTVNFLSTVFNVKSFTKSWLTSGFWIAYVYLALLLILSLLRLTIRIAVDIVGRGNVLWMRSAIARERGVAAYRAWVPLERIRPANIPQEQWEEVYAWPANNRPPYLPFWQRMTFGIVGYAVVLLSILALLQFFTSFPVITWFGQLISR